MTEAVSALAIAEDRDVVEFERTAPDVTAFEAGAPHAGVAPALADEPHRSAANPALLRSTCSVIWHCDP